MRSTAARAATISQKTVKSRRMEDEAVGNGKKSDSSKEKSAIREQCGKAPAAKAGGQRRSFPGPPKPGSLVRLIKRRSKMLSTKSFQDNPRMVARDGFLVMQFLLKVISDLSDLGLRLL